VEECIGRYGAHCRQQACAFINPFQLNSVVQDTSYRLFVCLFVCLTTVFVLKLQLEFVVA